MNESGISISFLPETEIRDVFAAYAEALGELGHALITRIDSSRFASVAEVRRFFPRDIHGGRIEEYGLILTIPALLELSKAPQYFTGFDEIWFWRHEDAAIEPPAVRITSERPFGPATWHFDVEAELAVLRDWMAASQCVLALGDGCGLNYLTSAPAWVARLAQLRIPK